MLVCGCGQLAAGWRSIAAEGAAEMVGRLLRTASAGLPPCSGSTTP